MACTQLLQQLIGMSDFEETKFLSENKESPLLMGAYYYGKCMAGYFMESLDNDQLIQIANEAMLHSPEVLSGTFKVLEIHFFAAMSYLRVAQSEKNESIKQNLIKQSDLLLAKLKVKLILFIIIIIFIIFIFIFIILIYFYF